MYSNQLQEYKENASRNIWQHRIRRRCVSIIISHAMQADEVNLLSFACVCDGFGALKFTNYSTFAAKVQATRKVYKLTRIFS